MSEEEIHHRTLRVTHHVSKKERVCVICGVIIPAGGQYVNEVAIHEGVFETRSLCMECGKELEH